MISIEVMNGCIQPGKWLVHGKEVFRSNGWNKTSFPLGAVRDVRQKESFKAGLFKREVHFEALLTNGKSFHAKAKEGDFKKIYEETLQLDRVDFELRHSKNTVAILASTVAALLLVLIVVAPGKKHSETDGDDLGASHRIQHPLIEPDAYVANSEDPETIKAVEFAVVLIRGRGYRCDTVTRFRSKAFREAIEVSCNQHRYFYELKDVGGVWKVKVE